MAKKRKTKNQQGRKTSSSPAHNKTVVIQPLANAGRREMKLQAALSLASSLTSQARHEQAQNIYAQLVDQCPDATEPAIQLLKCFRTRGRMNAAQVQAYAMLNRFKTNSWAMAEVAAFFQDNGKIEQATDILLHGLENCNNDQHVLWRTLGSIYSNQGRNDVAIEAFQQALSIKEDDIFTLFRFTLVAKQSHRDEILEKLLAASKTGNYPAHESSYLNFSLAYLYEGFNDDKYFHHLSIGNAAVAQDPTSWIKESKYNLLNTTQQFPDKLKAITKYTPKKKAPIFIIAPARSGTTLVEQIIGSHPAAIGVGESTAFMSAINRTSRDLNLSYQCWNWNISSLNTAPAKFEDYYYAHSKIPQNLGGKVVIDKSIENYSVVGPILMTWPNTRIIRLRRHPLDTILSCYHQFFTSGHNHLFNLETLAFYYVLVQKFMDFWQGLFPENIMTLEYESLISDQEQETKRLLQFCQLPWDDACLSFHQNIDTVLTMSNQQVRQPLYNKSVEKWKPFYKQLEPAINILERELNLSFSP